MESPFGSTVPTLRQGQEPDLSVCLLVTPVECRRTGAASFISCVPHGTSTINKLSYWVTRRLVKHGKQFFIVGGYESLEIWTSVILVKVRQRKSAQRNSGRVLFIKEIHCGYMLQDVGNEG